MDNSAILQALGRLEEHTTVPKDAQERAVVLNAFYALRSLVHASEVKADAPRG